MGSLDRVLIIEDDIEWVGILKPLLDNVGFHCEVANNYIDAIKKIGAFSPLALILDLNLGNTDFNQNEWDGWQLAEAAKERNISSIVLTGYHQDYIFGRAFREFDVVDVFDKKNFYNRKAVFIQRVHEAIKKTQNNPKTILAEKPVNAQRNKVFISYSHKDKPWLDKFRTNLKTLERNKLITVWDDTKIKSGARWKEDIKVALSSAKAALLLVTPDFLASDFIYENELPPILNAATAEGLTIFWVAVRPSLVEETDLIEFQAANDPGKPLSSLSDAAAEKEIVEICREIKEILRQ